MGEDIVGTPPADDFGGGEPSDPLSPFVPVAYHPVSIYKIQAVTKVLDNPRISIFFNVHC